MFSLPERIRNNKKYTITSDEPSRNEIKRITYERELPGQVRSQLRYSVKMDERDIISMVAGSQGSVK
jgi:hypothetical protein